MRLIEGLTGLPWKPENVLYGSLRTDRQAAYIRQEDERLDLVMLRENRPWRQVEKDPSRGRALPEHLEKAEFGHND